jgi:hypothetical protein
MLAGSSVDPNLALMAKPAQQKAEATEYQNHFSLRVFTGTITLTYSVAAGVTIVVSDATT